MTDADRKAAKERKKNKDKNTTKTETAQERLDRLFGEDGMLAKGLGRWVKLSQHPPKQPTPLALR